MEEIWKDIAGYEGAYQVSNLGRVKSFRQSSKMGKPKEWILKPSLINSGYGVVTLYSKEKREKFQIHRLVASAFLPNPNNLPCVNHRDENKLNNCVENLEWCTYQYNNNYGTAKVRAIDKVSPNVLQKTLDDDVIAIYKSAKIAAALLGYETPTLRFWCHNGIGGGYNGNTLRLSSGAFPLLFFYKVIAWNFVLRIPRIIDRRVNDRYNMAPRHGQYKYPIRIISCKISNSVSS